MTDPKATIVDPHNLMGRVVSDRYEVQEMLGEGSMGYVFLAEHTHMKKKVALKVMRPEFLENEEAVERFQREAQAAGHIDHPHVCAATDFGRLDDDRFFLVMEYLEGTNLGDRLAEEGPLLPERALAIVRRIASGLERAHELGVVHRDLKPDNIMLLDREGTEDFVKIMDFGVARVEVVSKQQLTQAGMTMGTPVYMSPEQAMAERADERSDLYSLGIIFFEMLTGSVPFYSESLAVILSKHTSEQPPSMHEVAPDELIPQDLCDIVDRLLAKDPEERFQTPRELIEALDSADLTPYVPGPSPASSPEDVGDPFEDYAPDARNSEEADTELDVDASAVSGADMFSSAEEVEPVGPVEIPRPSDQTTFSDLVERFTDQPPAVRYATLFTVIAVLATPLIVGAMFLVSGDATESEGSGEEPAAMEFSEGDVKPADLEEGRQDFLDDNDLEEKFGAAGPADAIALLESIEDAEAKQSPHYHYLLAKALVDNGSAEQGMGHYQEALAGEPRYASDGRLISDATRIFGEPKDEDAAPAEPVVKALLKSDPSGAATTSVFDVGIEGRWAARKRAREILKESGRWEELEPWQRTAIELRLTGKQCERIKKLVNELAESGEPRALPALRKTANRPRQGCGFLNKGDCYKCARKDLASAIDALEKAQGS
jgi:serine/threonine-protein kinase